MYSSTQSFWAELSSLSVNKPNEMHFDISFNDHSQQQLVKIHSEINWLSLNNYIVHRLDLALM